MSAGEKQEKTFPAWLSFLLDNPIRRRFDPPQKIMEKLGVNGGMVVLDFGCGPGFYTIPFARIAKQVVAVDLQAKMLEKVARKAARQGLKIQTLQSDGKHVEMPDESFDLAFLNHVYHEMEDKPGVLVELRRLLRPRGRLVIVESAKKPVLGLGPPAMKPELIAADLKAAGFAGIQTGQIKNRVLVVGTV